MLTKQQRDKWYQILRWAAGDAETKLDNNQCEELDAIADWLEQQPVQETEEERKKDLEENWTLYADIVD